MNIRTNLKNNQDGAVALITVNLFMFIFLVVTLGFLRMAINEQRQATDSDLNSRAYYAAESGIEDAKMQISRLYADGSFSEEDIAKLGGGGCDGPTNNKFLSIDLDTKITCQQIELQPGDFVASLGVNKSVFLPLIPTDGTLPDKVLIEWHERSIDGEDIAVRPKSAGRSLPKVSCWNSGEDNTDCNGTPYPAMIRAGLFSHPKSEDVTRESIMKGNKISYLPPIDGPGTVIESKFEEITATDQALPAYRISKQPKCSTKGETYVCRLEVTGLSGVNYLRLTSIYRGTNIRITMSREGTSLKFSNAQAKIDVTAQAGDVIRRVEARIPLRPADLLPDEAITTADQLCKLITITGAESAEDDCR